MGLYPKPCFAGASTLELPAKALGTPWEMKA